MLRLASILVWIAFVVCVSAQQYPFVPVNGSPRDVGILYEDSAGRIWAGTNKDALCFDGVHFYSLHDHGLPESPTRSLAEDETGGIWIGSFAGLFRYWQGQVEQMHKGGGESVVSVSKDIMLAALGPPGDGVPVSPRLYRFLRTDRGWQADELPVPDARGSLTRAPDGTILYPGEKYWFELSAAAIAKWQKGNPLMFAQHAFVAPATAIENVLRDKSGCLWFRNEHYTTYQCPGEHNPRQLSLNIASASGRPANRETADGRMILPSDNVLAIGRPGAFTVARPANGLPAILDAILAKDGALWLGGAKGLFRCPLPFRLEYWTERDGLSGPTAVLHLNNRLFVGDADGLKQLNADRRAWSPLPRFRETGPVQDIRPGPNGTIFAARVYQPLLQVASDGTLIRSGPPGSISGMKLASTPAGQLYVSGLGVDSVALKGRELKMQREELPPPLLNALDIETNPRDGSIWSCYAGGLIHKQGSSWQIFTEKDGLLENGCRSFTVRPNGDVWYLYNTVPAFSLIKMSQGGSLRLRHFRVPGEVGEFLDSDRRGWIWRGSSSGVYVADAAGAERNVWLHLGTLQGLPGLETNQQSFYDDPDGSVWFGAENTLTHFWPPADLLAKPSAKVLVSGFELNGGPARFAEGVGEIPRGTQVTALTGSLQLARGDDLTLRYRLSPDQPEWRESRVSELNLGKPRWGIHSLELQGRLAGRLVGFRAPSIRGRAPILVAVEVSVWRGGFADRRCGWWFSLAPARHAVVAGIAGPGRMAAGGAGSGY